MDAPWWEGAVVYQIYPRSFQDSDGDGLGDLNGIASRLDYLAELGVDALWLSPFYPSPDADFGYDIRDHTAVDPRFGTLDDFDRLVSGAHARGIKIVLDLVLNHTSLDHPWFVRSRASRGDPYRDWYLWADGRGSGPPNGWRSVFGGRAWERDPSTGQFYYHMFTPQQPDLNWRNPQVRAAQEEVVRFWRARGVDGFRLDVFNAWFKDDSLRENPPAWGLRGFDRQRHVYDTDRPEMGDALRALRAVANETAPTYLVGETFLPTPEKAAGYTGGGQLDAAFDFSFLDRRWGAEVFRRRIDRWQEALSGRWPCWVLSNHDRPRAASRYGDDARCRLAMALLLTLRGTAFLYYGEEIGLRDLALRRSQILDPLGKRYWPFHKGRDGCRAPMPWDGAAPGAGFTSGTPWLPLPTDFATRNVAAQRSAPDSLWMWTRDLLALRRSVPALRVGNFAWMGPEDRRVLAYVRGHGDGDAAVALEMSGRGGALTLPPGRWVVALSSVGRGGEVEGRVDLAASEALVLLRA